MVERATTTAEVLPAAEPPRRDSGQSFIELLVAVVLLGMVIVAVLAGLRATIIGTTAERDHARAHEWLQSASEVLVNDIAWVDCDPLDSTASAEDIRVQYEDDLQANLSIVPHDWDATQLTVNLPVAFAGPDSSYGPTCWGPIDRQLVTIQVRDTNGDVVETVEVINVP